LPKQKPVFNYISIDYINFLKFLLCTETIDDVILTKNPRFFEVMTGISQSDFSELYDKGFINRFALNRIVREFGDQEDGSLLLEDYVLKNLYEIAP
jgi:hypothetical protein